MNAQRSGKLFDQPFNGCESQLQFFDFAAETDSAIVLIAPQRTTTIGIDIEEHAGHGDHIFLQAFFKKRQAII